MTEFENWYRRNPGMNFTGHGELAWMKAKKRDQKIWKEALQWIKRELHAARDGFEPDLGLHNLLRRELGEEYNRKT